MVEKEMGSTLSGAVEGGHGFRPFGEVIDGNYDVLMAVRRCGSTLHEVDGPFTKGTNGDDWV